MFNSNFINPLKIFIIMPKNSFDYQANLSRHSHNISAGFTSSLTTGPIVPQFFDILGPGDSVYFTPKCFARLQDIVAPFFGEVDLHFDAFFVPLQMLYLPFGQIFSQTNDVISTNFASYSGGDVLQKDSFPLMETSWKSNQDLRGFYYGHKECFGKETMRLLDALDCNPISVLTASNAASSKPAEADTPDTLTSANIVPNAVSPWFFLAYQAIYQKFYRNDDLERFDVSTYNIDNHFRDDTFRQSRCFQLRYCQRPNDYFTSTKVSPLASAVNAGLKYPQSDDPTALLSRFPENGGSLTAMLSKVNDYLGFGSSDYSYHYVDGDNSNIFPNSLSNSDLETEGRAFNYSSVGQDVSWSPTAANIRALFAVDKFVRIYGRAGKTYDEQIEAHFGVKIPHDVKHDLSHIKHYKMSLVAEPVYSTADTGEGGSSIGQVGGQSSNSLNASQEKFTAPVHGVFMIVAYANSKPRYCMTFNKLHTLASRLDFPIPEFDKLGMQPLYAYEVDPNYCYQNTASHVNRMSIRVGWQRRYHQFKQKYNRVSLLYLRARLGAAEGAIYAENAFSPYVLSRNAFRVSQSLEYLDESKLLDSTEFFETPEALNGVMAVEYSGAWSNDYWLAPQSVFDTDPIIMDFYCDAKKVSWMSETGEPDL